MTLPPTWEKIHFCNQILSPTMFSAFRFIPSLHFLYLTNNCQKALQEYSSISEKLPPTNFAMRRDVQEGQARCLVRLGRRAEALEIAANLVSGFMCFPRRVEYFLRNKTKTNFL